MPYCTLDDILAILPESDLMQLTDDNTPAEMVDEAKVSVAINGAGELIDGYLRGRYALPITPVPLLLTTLAADIARYRLYSLRIRITPPEMVVQAYKDAISLLGQIQLGKVALGTESSGGGVTADADGAEIFAGPGRLFGRDRMGGY